MPITQTDPKKVKINDVPFMIYDSLKVGDTIYSGEHSYTVKTEEALESLQRGNAPRGKAKVETAEVEQSDPLDESL